MFSSQISNSHEAAIATPQSGLRGAKEWKLSESSVCRIVHKIENILIKSREFRLPGKQKLWPSSTDEELVVMDVMESQIERPKKRQKQFYSGKQREHTLKTQLVIQQKTGQIVCLVNGKGKTHDFKLFKNSGVKFGTLMKVIADKRDQGIAKIHQLSETPIKKKKGDRCPSARWRQARSAVERI